MDAAQVILVDEKDNSVGVSEKMKAHTEGLLHRAFSVFIFNDKGEMLLQQRALNKYHSGGLWTNACCSHPSPGEETETAATRRLLEEMGFVTAVEKIFDFIYKADVENGLTEYEFDHVFVGRYSDTLNFNTEEVMAVTYKTMPDITEELKLNPERYTAWFQIAFPKIKKWWSSYFNSTIAK